MKNATHKMGGSKVTKSPGAAKPAPFYEGAQPHKPSAPKVQPNNPKGANRHVTLDKAPQGDAGKGNQSSTFLAPRKDPSTNPTDSGYSRVRMYTGGNGKGNGNR